jgi:PqqD family protein of HPr-rel-A system
MCNANPPLLPAMMSVGTSRRGGFDHSIARRAKADGNLIDAGKGLQFRRGPCQLAGRGQMGNSHEQSFRLRQSAFERRVALFLPKSGVLSMILIAPESAPLALARGCGLTLHGRSLRSSGPWQGMGGRLGLRFGPAQKAFVLKEVRPFMIRKATDHFAETPLDDELVLMNIDTGSFHALKGTGLAIWHLIDGSRDEAAVCAALQETYEVDPQTCQAEVGRFIDQMAEAGFVERT